MSSAVDLEQRIASISSPGAVVEGKEYYAFRLSGTLDGRISFGVTTHWVGWEDGRPGGNEVREASLIEPTWFIEAWQKLGEPFLVANCVGDAAIFLGRGGNALIENSVARTFFPRRLAPQVYHATSSDYGEVYVPKPKRVFERAPTPLVRMKVLERDKYRCRICGRRPADNADVELNIHHVIPWSEGGLSEQKNLITLCRTCHRGLLPHFQPDLFDLLPESERPTEVELRFDYRLSAKLYQRAWARDQ